MPNAYGSEIIQYITDDNSKVNVEYEIMSEEVTYMTKENEHCRKYCESYDFDGCISNYMISKMNCTLPWVSENLANSLPPCMHPGEYDLYKILTRILQLTNEEMVFKYTGCMPCCSRNEIHSKLVARDNNIEKSPFYSSLYHLEQDYVIMRFFYASNKITSKEEYYTYDTSNLIADFGGYLGLLLGYSILGFYDTIISILKSLVVKWKK